MPKLNLYVPDDLMAEVNKRRQADPKWNASNVLQAALRKGLCVEQACRVQLQTLRPEPSDDMPSM